MSRPSPELHSSVHAAVSPVLAALNTALSSDDVKDSITPVELTAVLVCLSRARGACMGPGGKQLYDGSCDAAIADLAMPQVSQEKVSWLVQDPTEAQKKDKGLFIDRCLRMAIRTVTIDEQVTAMLAEGDAQGGTPLRQVVIVGAGLDCRAWRLPWPAGTVVYEVDSGSVESLKQRALATFPLKIKRVFLQCDLGLAGDLQAKLAAAGHVASESTLWLMEGLIGYLTRPQGKALFRTMAQLSPLGSRLLMTVPPTEQDRLEWLKSNGYKLQHKTMEEPKHTLRRLGGEGWSGTLRTGADISAAYDVPYRCQGQIYAHRTAPRGRRGCSIM